MVLIEEALLVEDVIASVCVVCCKEIQLSRHEWTRCTIAIFRIWRASFSQTRPPISSNPPYFLAAVHSFIQPVIQMSTFWRAAKLSYLEYVNHSSSAVRAALKEPLRSKAAVRGKVHLRERWYEGGVPGESKYFFVSLNDALRYMLQKAIPGGPSMLDFVLT
jgi:hypothetical protein